MYKQIDGNEVVNILHIIFHPKLDVLMIFTGNLCAKYQRNYLFMKGSEFLNDEIFYKTSRLDSIEFDKKTDNINFI